MICYTTTTTKNAFFATLVRNTKDRAESRMRSVLIKFQRIILNYVLGKQNTSFNDFSHPCSLINLQDVEESIQFLCKDTPVHGKY